MKITPLSDGIFTVGGSKEFIPFVEGEDDLKERKKGSLLLNIQPFLVETSTDLILLDAGLGRVSEDGQLTLYKNILNAGYHPEDVTKVLMSHLHKDHCGGLLNPYTKSLSFENAQYYIQKRELEFAVDKGMPSYNTDIITAIEDSDKVVLLTDDNGMIDTGIRFEVTHAHSRFHQVFWIEDQNETVFFGADDAPQLGQMKRRMAAKYDFDGKKAMELRIKWWEEGTREGWKFLFYHDVNTAVY